MLISKILPVDDMEVWEEEDDDECHEFADHVELKERLRKTLYFGKTPKMDRPSLPMTELAVEYFHDTVPRQLGKVDMYWASSVTRKASVSPCAMMLGMLYIERLKHKNPEYIQKMTSEELFLVSMMLASKYLQDEGVTEEVYNDEWADSANIDLEDLNQLERDFLSAIDWNLYVTSEAFNASLLHMEHQVVVRQVIERGYCTYTELWLLLYDGNIREQICIALGQVYKVVVICSVAYVAGMMMVMGCATTLSTLRLAAVRLDVSPPEQLSVSVITPLTSAHDLPGMDMAFIQDDQLRASDENRSVPHQGEPLGFSGRETGHIELSSEVPVLYKEDQPSASPEMAPQTESKISAMTSICNFLTLTLVKDTFMAFVVGVSSKFDSAMKGDDVVSVDSNSEKLGHHVCQCPRCPITNQNNGSQGGSTEGRVGCRSASPCLANTGNNGCSSVCCSLCRQGDNSCFYGNKGLLGADPNLKRSDSAQRSLYTWSQLIQQEAGVMGNPFASHLALARLQPISV